MNVAWVKEDILKEYLNGANYGYDGDRFGGTLVAITYNPNNGEYTVISR